MSRLTLILCAVCLLLVMAFLTIGRMYLDMRKNKLRIEENFTQIQSDNQLLNLKYSEAEKYHNDKLDSVIKANKIRPKEVISATIIRTEYKDTGSVKIVYKEPFIAPDTRYIIPISYDNGCWGMKGEIISTDAEAKLDIRERTSDNNVQALITRKRVIGFLWWKKKIDLQVFRDCGKANVTQINYQ